MSNRSEDILWCEATARSFEASAAKSAELASNALREIRRLESCATTVPLTKSKKAQWQEWVLVWKMRQERLAALASYWTAKARQMRELASELSKRPPRDIGNDAL